MNISILSFRICTLMIAITALVGFSPVQSEAATIGSPQAVRGGLVGYWSFDGKDVTDKVYDRSGQGNHGYINGAATSSMQATGKIGQGMRFNASSYVNTLTTSSSFADTTFSVSGWFMETGATSQGKIIDNDDCDGGWAINAGSGFLGANLRGNGACGGGAADRSSVSRVDDGKWHHFVVIFTTNTSVPASNSITIYLDGVLDQGSLTNGGVSYGVAVDNTVQIGARYSGFDGFPGVLDEIRIYNRALSATEVKTLYRSGKATPSRTQSTSVKNGLIGRWTFDGNTFFPTTTIGTVNDTVSGTESNNSDTLEGYAVTVTRPTNVTSLSIYAVVAAGDVRLGIYDATGPSGHAGNKLGETNAFTAVSGWNTADLISPVTLTPGTYWLEFLFSSSAFTTNNVAASSANCWYSYAFGAMPATYSASPTCNTQSFWFYASGNGTADDISGNNNYLNDHATYVTQGKTGQGAQFAGSDGSYFDNTNALNNDLGPLSVSGWITGGGASQALLYKSNDIGQGWEVLLDYNNTLCFIYYGTTQLFRCAPLPQSYPIQKWMHFTAVKDDASLASTSVHLYFDGIPVSTYTVDIGGSGSHDSDASHTLFVGREENGGFRFDGKMDDLRLYNRALTPAEVKTIFNEGGGITVGKSQSSLISNGLIGYYSFNGPDFTDAVYDRSGQGNNGGVIGIATSSIKSPGRIGQGVNFRRVTGEYITLGDLATYDGLTQFTESAWIKTSVNNQEMHIIDKSTCDGGVDNGTFELHVFNQYSSMGIYPSGAVGSFLDGTDVVTDGRWHMVTGVYDGSNIRMYVDGAQSSSASVGSFTLSSNNRSVEIGGNCNGSVTCTSANCSFNGSIDEVRMYNRALSATEIKRLYQAGK